MLGHYVSKRGLANLHAYKYSGVDNSLVAKHIMQPFWGKAVNLLPLWMAPNLVTLLGFLFILLSYAATSYYHPSLVGQGPTWLYVFNALCMFVYQTMDALDGKQARRTGSSSPLGELFDHGCDAVTTVVGTITLGCTLGVEKNLFLVTLMLMMMTFYFTQWEEYYTGTLTLGYIGVTEAQISAMGIYLLTAAAGPAWWGNVAHIYGWSVQYGSIPFIVSASSMIPTAASNFKEVFAFHSQKGKGLFGALFNTVPVMVLSAGFLAWAAYSHVYYTHPQAFLLAYGFLVSNLVGRIVLARVCMERFQPLQPLVAPLLVVPLLVIHGQYEGCFLIMYCAVAVCGYFHFALSVIQDLCDTLGIKCLSISKVK